MAEITMPNSDDTQAARQTVSRRGRSRRGSGSGQLAEQPEKKNRKYMAFRPPEDVATKLHIITRVKGMTPTDYILNHLIAQIEEDYEQVVEDLHAAL